MCPPQWERGVLFVIEEGGLPFHTVVTFNTVRDIAFGELLPVDVLVAILADRWRSLEVDVEQPRLEIWRLVTVGASGRAMSAE